MKRKTISLLMCMILISSLLAVPASAGFEVTYYNETVYAGGILDLYAFVGESDLSGYTFQWQFDSSLGDGHWNDLQDNEHYKGTKTNHLQVYTIKENNYYDWDQIPFQCVITKNGETKTTPDIFMHILPYSELGEDLKAWGFGLYEPTVTNSMNFSELDNGNYTAYAYAGSNLEIFCGGNTATQKQILANSEVELRREIRITENGKYITTGDRTSYIPYTVGPNAVKIEVNMRILMAGVDMGVYQTKTIYLTTQKPIAKAKGTALRDCSLLRYTYNESAKLASIPKGTSVDVVAKEGGYYQVFYNNMVGYVDQSVLTVDTAVGDSVIKHVDVQVETPAIGNAPWYNPPVNTVGCELYLIEPVTWWDQTTGKAMKPGEKFQKDHAYTVQIWVAAKEGYQFAVDAYGNIQTTANINDYKARVYAAYEQDPEQVIEISRDYGALVEIHTCKVSLVKRVEPSCTEDGHEAYFHCDCGMNYADGRATQPISVSTWGILPATGHRESAWRITQVYHYSVCTVCGDMLQQEDHMGGKATCYEKGKCTVCGYAYIEENENHTPDTQWTACGGLYHAKLCKFCGAHCDPQDHVPGAAATETTAQTCQVCGYILTPAKGHTHRLTKVAAKAADCTQPGNMEYYTCSGCSDWFADAQASIKLTDPNKVILAPLGHTPSDSWDCGDELHWRSCTRCKQPMEETRFHHEDTDRDGKCDTCGYIPSSTTPTQPSGPAAQTPTDEPQQSPGVTVTLPTESPAPGEKSSLNWVTVVLLALVCFGASVTAAVIVLKIRKK